jgi:DNA-binding NtrC family response regulator
VLVVDDEPDVRELLQELLANAGYVVTFACDLAELRLALARTQPDVVLLDMRLPDGDGIDMIAPIKARWPETEVIMLTCHASIETAVDAMKRGAFHFRPKPFQTEELKNLVQRACECRHLNARAETLQRVVSTLTGGSAPVFKSQPMRDLLRHIERVAPSEASIMVCGESGTGKEVVADLVHSLSARSEGPFIKVNCAAMPATLIESELFGAVKGAYTGSHTDREGLFQQATGGTILLDEITEMPLETQAKLLRVLQDKIFRPVGGKESVVADCRVISSSNRPVQEAIREHRLRPDLFYRISTITLNLPPLRERRDDILPLAQAFLRRFNSQAGRNITGFTPAAIATLQRYDWPGNVRELENQIQRGILMAEGAVVDVADFDIDLSPPPPTLSVVPAPATPAVPVPDAGEAGPEPVDLRVVQREAVLRALRECGGNKAAAAARLGVTRQTLYNKLRQYGLEPGTLAPLESAADPAVRATDRLTSQSDA